VDVKYAVDPEPAEGGHGPGLPDDVAGVGSFPFAVHPDGAEKHEQDYEKHRVH
jgi:hypothetical protein